MPIKQSIKGAHDVLIWTDDIEDTAREQLTRIADLPIIHRHVAVMPDVHWGKGATVGSVIACKGAVIPAAVGVDIGCGMLAVKLTIKAADLPDSLAAVRLAIEAVVPVGFNEHAADAHSVSLSVARQVGELQRYLRGIQGQTPEVTQRDPLKWIKQIGTLGGGNHFIELCLDVNTQDVWVMLHSGSRNIGKTIAEVFIERARNQSWAHLLPDRDLAWLDNTSADYIRYVEAVEWAQYYAAVNRRAMLERVFDALRTGLGRDDIGVAAEVINCHHNYISTETHFGHELIVTRKGAIRAGLGDMGIIPGSMGDRSFIVRGKGNEMAFCSCSHGAGRKMSRGAAKKAFTLEDMAAQTAGVECRKDADVLDEIPGAYKDIQVVMDNQSDLVDIVATLKQILCVKG